MHLEQTEQPVTHHLYTEAQNNAIIHQLQLLVHLCTTSLLENKEHRITESIEGGHYEVQLKM